MKNQSKNTLFLALAFLAGAAWVNAEPVMQVAHALRQKLEKARIPQGGDALPVQAGEAQLQDIPEAEAPAQFYVPKYVPVQSDLTHGVIQQRRAIPTWRKAVGGLCVALSIIGPLVCAIAVVTLASPLLAILLAPIVLGGYMLAGFGLWMIDGRIPRPRHE